MKAQEANASPFVLDPKSMADLRVKLKQDPQGGLKQAAQQFEGMLLQMMLKSMRDATPQDGPLNSDQTRFFTSIMDQQLAQNLSAHGKLGFAKLVEQQLGRNRGSGTKADPAATALEGLKDSFSQGRAAGSAAASPVGAERVRGVRAAKPVLPAAGAAADAVAPAGAAASAGEFVNRIWPHAVEAAKAVGVPAQYLVAHSALESAWGKSEIRAANDKPSYNLFGIKAGRNWQGASVEQQTTEYVNGSAQSVREKFRVYGSYSEAFRDYANLLKSNTRFSQVLGQRDGKEFARSLQQSGYATDPMYADKLARIINGSTLRQALTG